MAVWLLRISGKQNLLKAQHTQVCSSRQHLARRGRPDPAAADAPLRNPAAAGLCSSAHAIMLHPHSSHHGCVRVSKLPQHRVQAERLHCVLTPAAALFAWLVQAGGISFSQGLAPSRRGCVQAERVQPHRTPPKQLHASTCSYRKGVRTLMSPHRGGVWVSQLPQHWVQAQRLQPHRVPPQQLQVAGLRGQQEQDGLARVAHARCASHPVHVPAGAGVRQQGVETPLTEAQHCRVLTSASP